MMHGFAGRSKTRGVQFYGKSPGSDEMSNRHCLLREPSIEGFSYLVRPVSLQSGFDAFPIRT